MAYQSVTLTALLLRLAEKYEDQPFWSADDARRAINEGLRIWNTITGMWSSPITVTTIPNDPHLFVSGTLLKATRVSIAGRRLEPTSLAALDLAIPNWEGATTASGGIHPTQVVYWAPIGLTEIMVYPADAVAEDVIVDGVRATPILVNGSDYLNLGDEEISTLLGYALHVLSFGKGAEMLTRTGPMKVAFYHAAAKRNSVFAASSVYRRLTGVDRSRFIRPIEQPLSPGALAAIDGTGGAGGQS